MKNPSVHWILDVVPLVALLLVAAFMYALRQRRDEVLPASPLRKARSNPSEFSRRPMGTDKFGGGAVSPRAPGSVEPIFKAPNSGQAWDTLQVRLIRLVEQDERGGADIQDLHRAVADYDLVRSEARY